MARRLPRRTVGSYEAKTHLAHLIDEVRRGVVITITRRGKAVARLVPAGEEVERSREAFDRWLELRARVRPLGMKMTQAVRLGRKR